MQKVEVGDKVKILAVDWVTAEWQPKLLNSEQVITGFDSDGEPEFAWDVPNPKDCPFQRHNNKTMCIDAEFGWRFEVVE